MPPDMTTMRLTDVLSTITRLHDQLTTAKATGDAVIVNASLIDTVEGLLSCMRCIASELVRVELEGIDSPLP